MPIQKLLFAPRCWSCGEPLKRGRDFCFSCRRDIFRALSEDGFLLRYQGAVKGLLSCLRGSAPYLGVAWCLRLLERQGKIAEWRQGKWDAVVLAPQNPKRGERGLRLLGLAVSKRLGIPLLEPFAKWRQHSQHGRSVSARMDSACFVRLFPLDIRGKKILLLDDVDTTGTTLDQCAYLLTKAGARLVERYALARQMEPVRAKKKLAVTVAEEEMEAVTLQLFM